MLFLEEVLQQSLTHITNLPGTGKRCFLKAYHDFTHKEENQLDATEWFIALIICSTCFGHLYAHHQGPETILLLLLHMVCNALVAGGRRSGAGQQTMRPG